MMLCCPSTTDNKVTKKELSKALHDAVAAAKEGSSSSNAELSILSEDRYEEILDVFVDAFQKDPMVSYLVNLGDDVNKFDDKQKELFKVYSRAFLGWVQRVVMKRQKGFTLGALKDDDNNNNNKKKKRVVGAISIVPSGQPYMTICDMISNSFEISMPTMDRKTKREYGPYAAERLMALSIVDEKRKEIMMNHEQRRRYIFVQVVGVLTSCHGQKIGSKMLRLLMNVADSLEAYMYLETESLENESMYKHFGFYTQETVDVSVEKDTSTGSNTSLRMYLMIRDPKV
mmetsp:Transcript_132370/g.186894  ORF Transcript_132370/g.186894 Transcript_132370/m.186894 type:complete len:286 (+) Transcript_132370:37-894(+)